MRLNMNTSHVQQSVPRSTSNVNVSSTAMFELWTGSRRLSEQKDDKLLWWKNSNILLLRSHYSLKISSSSFIRRSSLEWRGKNYWNAIDMALHSLIGVSEKVHWVKFIIVFPRGNECAHQINKFATVIRYRWFRLGANFSSLLTFFSPLWRVKIVKSTQIHKVEWEKEWLNSISTARCDRIYMTTELTLVQLFIIHRNNMDSRVRVDYCTTENCLSWVWDDGKSNIRYQINNNNIVVLRHSLQWAAWRCWHREGKISKAHAFVGSWLTEAIVETCFRWDFTPPSSSMCTSSRETQSTRRCLDVEKSHHFHVDL